MLYSEFCERTNKRIPQEEYFYVVDSYYEFDGDKDEFYKQWLKDVESGKWAMEYKFRKALDDQKAEYEKQLAEKEVNLEFYREYVKELREDAEKFRSTKRHLKVIMNNLKEGGD